MPNLNRALRCLAACALLGTAAARAKSPPPSNWDGFVSAFLDGFFALQPDSGVAAGRHEFDGRIPDWSGRSPGSSPSGRPPRLFRPPPSIPASASSATIW